MVDMPAPQPQRIVLPPHRQRAQRPRSVRLREWLRRSLFNSPWGSVLTVITAAILGLIVFGVVYFVFVDANWRVVTDNRWLLFAGGYPHEEAWRLWFSIGFVFTLIGLAYGTWASLGRRDHFFILLATAFMVFLMAHGGAAFWSSLWFLIAIALLYRRLRDHGADATGGGAKTRVAAARRERATACRASDRPESCCWPLAGQGRVSSRASC